MFEWREKIWVKVVSFFIIGVLLSSNFTWTLKTDFSSLISPIIFNHYLNKASSEEKVGFFEGLREAISSILLPSASAEPFDGYGNGDQFNRPIRGYENNWKPIAESIDTKADTVDIGDTVEIQVKSVENTNDTVIEQKNDLADKIILRLIKVVNNALRRLIQMNDKLSPSSTGIAGIIQKIKEVYEELLKLSLNGDDSGDEPEANDNSEKDTENTGVETAPELLTANNSDDTRRSNAINTETGKTTYSPRNSLVMENISGSSYSTGHGDASQSIMSNYYKNDAYSGNASQSIMANYYKNDAYSGNASQSIMANYYKNDTYSGNASQSIMANYYKNDAYSTGSGNAWQEMRDEMAARQAEAKNAWQEMRDEMAARQAEARDAWQEWRAEWKAEMAARQAEAKNAWQEMRDEMAARQAEARNAWQEMRDDMAARQAEARAEYAKYRDRFQTMGNYNYENYNPVLSGKITPEDRVSDIEEFIREHSNRGPPDRDSIKKAFDEGAVFNCAWETLVQLLPHVDPLDLARELADPQYTDSETNQTSMFGIYEISKRYGLELTGVELTLNQLKQTVSENGYAIIHEDSGNGMGHWRKITDISEIDIDKWSGNCLVKTVPEGARLLSDEEMKDIWGALTLGNTSPPQTRVIGNTSTPQTRVIGNTSTPKGVTLSKTTTPAVSQATVTTPPPAPKIGTYKMSDVSV